jgi:hypothetical protein
MTEMQRQIESVSYFDIPEEIKELWSDAECAYDRGDYAAGDKVREESIRLERIFLFNTELAARRRVEDDR